MSGDFVIGLGTNLGERTEHLCAGATLLAALSQVRVLGLSSVFESDALGPPQPRYLNAALRLTSELSAPALLERLLAVEASRGRIRTLRWGPRTLDLDILWASEPFASERLHVPHAHLHERAFALAPLLEVAPELATVYAEPLRALGGAPLRVGRLVAVAAPGDSSHVVFERSGAAPV
ncbi:MAG TPA: 2-amino-4-hydroxy-6-hydroxymethyldihydropteridine diphosphokinase [Polyangiales bacterium]